MNNATLIRNVVRGIIAAHDKLLADRSKPIRLVQSWISKEVAKKLLPPPSLRTNESIAEAYQKLFDIEVRKQLTEHLLETIT